MTETQRSKLAGIGLLALSVSVEPGCCTVRCDPVAAASSYTKHTWHVRARVSICVCACLSLSLSLGVKVVELADATLYSENEQLDNLCRRMLNLPKPTFDHLNQVIASQLVHLCLPVRSRINIVVNCCCTITASCNSVAERAAQRVVFVCSLLTVVFMRASTPGAGDPERRFTRRAGVRSSSGEYG